jgi:hypothetical protein
MDDTPPLARRDLEFFPVQHEGQQFVLIRDHLGLVQEGKAVGLLLYQIMTLLDGNTTVRDLQMELMRQKGGVLVGTDEINGLLAHLDESFLLDSERYKKARDGIITEFTSKRIRPCSHCGKSYPENPSELRVRLDEILNSELCIPEPEGKIEALVAPHIDLNVGYKSYSSAYQLLKHTTLRGSYFWEWGINCKMPSSPSLIRTLRPPWESQRASKLKSAGCGKGGWLTVGIAEKGIVGNLSGGCPSPAMCVRM